ncbi:ATPase WRNIP1 [Anabarilius grahami]|uniref:ATPase WRNIP1 n=1 Tax=Anabarilius grahami TaxID=495550 RepID=A0A3N0YLI4_ANAGA|nr:ATPase WRNIP1 [Anabarilius grahami]
MAENASHTVKCPVCAVDFEPGRINAHLDECLQSNDVHHHTADQEPSEPPSKKPRSSTTDTRPSAVFSVFQTRSKVTDQKQKLASTVTCKESTEVSVSPYMKVTGKLECPDVPAASAASAVSSPKALRLNNDKPLAEVLRPSTLEEYFGQNKLIGEQTLLRSLLQSQEIPSLILWGPPGCGKTTLAHIIASSMKKKGTGRFITLSATSASTSDVREVIKQAQNELRLCKRKTVLFIDEIHRFNKSQQDTFLPHVECGTITLIGATTENPSFQVNSALLSRCRVLVLERLSVEEMGLILRRAVDFLGLKVLNGDPVEQDYSEICLEVTLHLNIRAKIQTLSLSLVCTRFMRSISISPAQGMIECYSVCVPMKPNRPSIAKSCIPIDQIVVWYKVCIEQKALDTVAHLCDGDARAALNGLQLAVQACVVQVRIASSKPSDGPQQIIVREQHIKEGLQRSHILYDKAGEEHYNCISALHKSMRGSEPNAALYWLGRMLEGGEDPLYVARRLVRFASEDIGLADPVALTQAVSAFQACHFIGMPECEVILAQCVVYMARAPKSVEVYKAYNNVKACLRNHQGPLPYVPLHLRNAPTKLMKNLGYAKGYKYNPNFNGPVDQEYLPEELHGVNFFTWTPSNQ